MKIEITEEVFNAATRLLTRAVSDKDSDLIELTSKIIGAYEWAKIEAEENE